VSGNNQDLAWLCNGATILIYLNLTFVNLNCPILVRSDCSMWPGLVCWSYLVIVRDVATINLRRRRHGHDLGQATWILQTRTHTPCAFCLHFGRNTGRVPWLLSGFRCGDVHVLSRVSGWATRCTILMPSTFNTVYKHSAKLLLSQHLLRKETKCHLIYIGMEKESKVTIKGAGVPQS
jgi:hypothetical protein